MEERLYEKLLSISETMEYPFHMPGHKRNETESPFAEMMKLDITEIEGFDNLHHPEGIIKQEQEFAAKLYGAKETFFLVNGSTCGILSAITAVTNEGEKIIFSRNSHKSAYHALVLNGLVPIYVYPQNIEEKSFIYGKMEPETIADAMDESGAKVVFLTSPTYEGVISDIKTIADEVHKRRGILIVDEAHGAHLGFHPAFPKSSVGQGADIVIQSMHKNLPSLTQTALLHICSDRVNSQQLRSKLAIFQTSSPSYLLMASMSRCLHFLDEKGDKKFEAFAERLHVFYEKTKDLQHLKVLYPQKAEKIFSADFDPSKIIICAENLFDETGREYKGKDLAKDLLQNYRLQMEMVSEKYVLAMTSICDTQEGFFRLAEALFEIDKRLTNGRQHMEENIPRMEKPIAAVRLKDALNAEKIRVLWENCVDKISAEYIYLYPPGSPIVTPGEKISSSVWEMLEHYKKLGLNVQGPEDYRLKSLWILRDV